MKSPPTVYYPRFADSTGLEASQIHLIPLHAMAGEYIVFHPFLRDALRLHYPKVELYYL